MTHKKTPATTPLPGLRPNARAKVVSLGGGTEFKQRLASMGILPGAELKVVRCGSAGPVIVEVRGGQYILGHGMAQRVVVQRVP